MTIREYLNAKLPQELAEKAIANTESQGWLDLDTDDGNPSDGDLESYDVLHEVLSELFDWEDSPEGPEFWEAIVDSAYNQVSEALSSLQYDFSGLGFNRE